MILSLLSITMIRVFFLLFVLSVQVLRAQESAFLPFLLEGTINVDTGTVQLSLVGDDGYYPLGKETAMSAQVNQGRFFFRSRTPYPIGVRLSYERQYRSSVFVIEPGTQTIVCNVDSSQEVPTVSNLAMKEYEKEFGSAFKDVRQKRRLFDIKRDSLNQLYQNDIPMHIQLSLEQEMKAYYKEGDQVLLQYVAAHPNSYLALWRFIDLVDFGYESIFPSIFDQFSDSLKATITGRTLAKRLETASALAVGKPFPLVTAVDTLNNSLRLDSLSNNRFTFIDFWYSNCGPCIAQFPHLRKIYDQYKVEGFEVIGISTDRAKYQSNWLKAIQKYHLSWPQYWDKDGTEASRLSINKFPTNYLLDSEGKILHRDLRPVELEQFLEENMKQ